MPCDLLYVVPAILFDVCVVMQLKKRHFSLFSKQLGHGYFNFQLINVVLHKIMHFTLVSNDMSMYMYGNAKVQQCCFEVFSKIAWCSNIQDHLLVTFQSKS